ncbi:hypothetical protein O3M35_003388 [Rhynocoris fuscipes]|uniref:Uncharacterized protein n=1 Tax=Rhynocoris fuscipes TaxID=488301 RepID=A0AAW1CIR5_9HEMI
MRCELHILIILLSLLQYLNVGKSDENPVATLKEKEKLLEDYEENLKPFISAWIRMTSKKLSDSEKLDRWARGAEYVDKFDSLAPGDSDLLNPTDIKDFAKDPSLNFITTYGEERLKEENIKRNLFKTYKDPIYFADDKERKIFMKNSSVFPPSTSVLNFMKSLVFNQ